MNCYERTSINALETRDVTVKVVLVVGDVDWEGGGEVRQHHRGGEGVQ